MHIRSPHWDIRLEITENENPYIRPEIRILSYRRLSDVAQGPFFKLKIQVSLMVDAITLAELKKSVVWKEYHAAAPREQVKLLTRVLNQLSRNQFRTLGQIRELSVNEILGQRNFGPESTRLICALFENE